MADSPPAPSPSRPNPRAAALAAAEARLRPPTSPASDTGAAAPSATTPSPIARAGTSSPKFQPTEKEDRDTRVLFARALDRGLVRDNGYKQVAECVETLLLVARNILEHDDPKYRTLKATNSMLKNKILNLKGGHDYLIQLGFRVATVDFTQQYVFQPSLKKMHELRIGAEVLSDHLSELKTRASNAAAAAQAHRESEAARVGRAMAEIEADRDKVRERVARDKVMAGREERLRREEAERRERAEMEVERLAEEAERGTGGMPGANLNTNDDVPGSAGWHASRASQTATGGIGAGGASRGGASATAGASSGGSSWAGVSVRQSDMEYLGRIARGERTGRGSDDEDEDEEDEDGAAFGGSGRRLDE